MSGSKRTKAKTPAWLTEATTHLRRHYPHDGLSESVLWELYRVGFAVLDNEDVLEPLRRVSGVEVLR